MADAVFEGGGIKGIGLVGAVVEAEARGYRWCNLAGTSAGAIVASLLAAGYRGAEVARILDRADFNAFKDRGLLGAIPLVGPVASLLGQQGLYLGDAFENWLGDLLAARGIRTFVDLVMPEFAEDQRYRYRLRVIAADLTMGRLLVLPQDIRRYGYRPDDLGVARAVRMSMSIPFFYRPVFIPHRGRRSFRSGPARSVVVDGGVLSNFPVWLFDTDGPPEWPTFGFRLVGPETGRPRAITGPISLLKALFATMMEAHDARHVRERDFVRTIAIPTLGVGTVDFDISRPKRQELYEAGRRAAARFLDRWDFRSYVAQHRMDDFA